MPDKKYAEFLAAVYTGLSSLESKYAGVIPGLEIRSCIEFTCNNHFWATYCFTDKCPPDKDLRQEIVKLIRSHARNYKELNIVFHPGNITDSRNE